MNLYYILSIALPPVLTIIFLVAFLIVKPRLTKRILATLSAAMLVVTVIAVLSIVRPGLFGKTPNQNGDPYITDPVGTSYLAVELADGETYAAALDTDGRVYAAKILEDGSIGERVADISDLVDVEKLPKNYTGDPIEDSQNGDVYKGSVAPSATAEATAAPTSAAPTESNPTAAPTTAPAEDPTAVSKSEAAVSATVPTTAPTTTQPVRKTYHVDKYRKLFESGQFLIEFTTDEDALGDTPVTAAVKNGNLMMTLSIQKWDLKVIYRAADDKTYLLIPNIKKYLLVPEDALGDDLDMSEMVSDFAIEEDAEIETSQVTINDVPLVCETVTDKDGLKTQYYFDGDTLVRMDIEQEDGSVERTYISRISSDVPDSLFEIPTGYAFLNLPLDKLIG
ncbi:MAG: hypothetical protein IJL52_00985 [Clostridia bacterium]|nr:hypothetical protein [Clostridia bacterium]